MLGDIHPPHARAGCRLGKTSVSSVRQWRFQQDHSKCRTERSERTRRPVLSWWISLKILIVEHNKRESDLLVAMLSAWGHETEVARDGAQALSALERFTPGVIITELRMPIMDGYSLLRHLRQSGNFPPTIVLSAYGSLDAALSIVHGYGGFWFLEKPVVPSALQLLVNRAGAHASLLEENRILRRDLTLRGVLSDLVGDSPAIQEVFHLIRLVAPTNASVLITGESGTGKELAARAIHRISERRAGPFLAVNCAALPETLVESELFGHEKGAFTGAVERRIGCIEMAEGGTLFLDEISEMAVATQAKLLRVLQDLRYRRLGGSQEIQADVRVIAAMNRHPDSAIQDGRLREDLFYRLSVFHIEMPALRDRLEDLGLLVRSFIDSMNGKHGTQVSDASPGVLLELAGQRWPGNIRELRNVIERAVILAGSGEIRSHHLPGRRKAGVTGAVAATPDESSNPTGIVVGMSMDEAEQNLIEATLRHTGNNKSRAALLLGISAKTLHAKLRAYRSGQPGKGENG